MIYLKSLVAGAVAAVIALTVVLVGIYVRFRSEAGLHVMRLNVKIVALLALAFLVGCLFEFRKLHGTLR
jgi:hypothetical protein